MVKLNLILLFAVMISGMFLVHSQHENRLLFTAVTNELSMTADLELKRKRLTLTRQSFITPTRVAVDAQSVLKMRTPTLDLMEHVPLDQGMMRRFEAQVPSGVHLIDRQESNHE